MLYNRHTHVSVSKRYITTMVSVGTGKSTVYCDDMSAIHRGGSLKELYTYVQSPTHANNFAKDVLVGRITTAIHKHGGDATYDNLPDSDKINSALNTYIRTGAVPSNSFIANGSFSASQLATQTKEQHLELNTKLRNAESRVNDVWREEDALLQSQLDEAERIVSKDDNLQSVLDEHETSRSISFSGKQLLLELDNIAMDSYKPKLSDAVIEDLIPAEPNATNGSNSNRELSDCVFSHATTQRLLNKGSFALE